MLNVAVLLVGSLSLGFGFDHPLIFDFVENLGLWSSVNVPFPETNAVETKAKELSNAVNRALLDEFEVGLACVPHLLH